MTFLGISIDGGLHDGAVVVLPDDRPRRLGSAADADILLVDDTIAEHQCTLVPGDDDTLRLNVAADGMEACGRALAKDAVLALPVGGTIAMGPVRITVVRLVDTDADAARPTAQVPTEDELRRARRHIARQLHWRVYAADVLRANRRVLAGLLAVAGAGVVSLAMLPLLGTRPSDAQVSSEVATQLRALFPAVTLNPHPLEGLVIYEGYVTDTRELNQLRSLIRGLTAGRAVVRVVPMDLLEFQAATWLDAYYDHARVEIAGPGRLKVTVPSDAAIKRLEGWDLPAMQARLLQVLGTVESVSITIAQAHPAPVTLPAQQRGLSIVALQGGGAYAIGADGRRLFPGARTDDGRVLAISRCGLSLRSQDVGSVFHLGTQDPRCNQQHIPPAAASPSLEFRRGTTPH